MLLIMEFVKFVASIFSCSLKAISALWPAAGPPELYYMGISAYNYFFPEEEWNFT